jgi:hypothetical protein
MLPELCAVLIKEAEAHNSVRMVDGDGSYLFDCWYIIVIVSWIILISLSRSGTIGQDEVVEDTPTLFSVVFNANESMNHSTPLTYHSCRGKLKMLGAFCIDAYCF